MDRIVVLRDGGSATVEQTSQGASIRSPANVVRASQQGGGGGVSDYDALTNRPRIEGVLLTGNRAISEFGPTVATNQDILSLFN